MRVVLDGQSVNISQPSLAATLAAVSEIAESRGRMIVHVVVDGRSLTGDDITNAQEQNLPSTELHCTSADPGELVGQSLTDAGEALDEARKVQQQAAEMIQTGNTQEALDSLKSVLATWQAVRDVVDRGGKVLGVDFSTVRLPGIDDPQPVAQCTQSLMASLGQVKTALANEDWSLLSDIVGYDLDALAKDWTHVLSGLAQVASATAKRGGGP